MDAGKLISKVKSAFILLSFTSLCSFAWVGSSNYLWKIRVHGAQTSGLCNNGEQTSVVTVILYDLSLCTLQVKICKSSK